MSILRVRTLSDLPAAALDRMRGKGLVEPDAARNTASALDAGNAPCVLGEAAGSSAVAVAGGNDQTAPVAFLMLDYPVSVNRYWRNFKGRMVVSTEAIKYKRHVGCEYAMCGGKYHHTEPVCVEFRLHPKLTKAGLPSKTRIDLDNCLKVLLDALNNAAYQDDKQVVRLAGEIAHPVEGGGVSVRVMAL